MEADTSSKPDPAKVSHTAVLCAKQLAEESNVPYANEIWQKLKSYDSEVVKEGKGRINDVFRRLMTYIPGMSGIRTILEGRYIAVNRALDFEENPHVMELAAGLSPRGLDFTIRDPNQIYIETDLAGLQEIKREIADNIRKDEGLAGLASTPNYHLVPLNAVDRKQFVAAAKPYAESARDKPLAIVHAGLFPYLDRDEQRLTRDNIAHVLSEYSPEGMWITPDMALNRDQVMANPLMKWRIKKLERKTGRKFSFFESDEETREFLAEGGFRTEVIPSYEWAGDLSCVKTLGLNPQKVREKSNVYNTHKMKLN